MITTLLYCEYFKTIIIIIKIIYTILIDARNYTQFCETSKSKCKKVRRANLSASF